MKPRDALSTMGRGCRIIGVVCIAAGAHVALSWLLSAGEILVALGVILFIVQLWKQWQS
jgi:hypothetical protein